MTFHLPGSEGARGVIQTITCPSDGFQKLRKHIGIEIAMDEHFDFRELFVHTIFKVREMSSLYLYLHNLPLCLSFPQMLRHTFPNN